MKVLQINTLYPQGSTGKIAKGIYDLCLEENITCKVAYRYREKGLVPQDTFVTSSYLDCHIHNRIFIWTMLQGCFSFFRTHLFLKKVKRYDPDIIHLHNIHGSYLNHKLLFSYLKKYQKRTIWTLHDCWSFTGGCAYYDMAGCEKWQDQCRDCPQKRGFLDTSSFMHKKKKKWFSGLSNMTLVANSCWTAEEAKKSFMGKYPIKVIYNGIDRSVFKPTLGDFRTRYGLEDKKIVLGVAFGWGKRKGLDVFIKLAERLPDFYKIVLVGTDDAVDKILPKKILSIHRTQNQKELAEIYSAADVFVNPTREEAFGLVNIEALSCGTPGITFCTGGSVECYNEKTGVVVEKDDVDAMEKEIIRLCETKPFSASDCIQFAAEFDQESRYRAYINLYKEIYR